MPYLELFPNVVYRQGVLQSSGDPIWHDTSDATYTNITIDSSGADTAAYGWLDASTLDPALVTDIAVFARYKAETTEGLADFGVVMSIAWDTPGGGSGSAHQDVLIPRLVHSQSIINEDVWFLGADDYAFLGLDKAEVADRLTRTPANPLAQGMRNVRFEFISGFVGDAPASGVRSFTIYEASVRLYYNEATPATRLWPRDDNRGISATNRIHPPPRANRIVGGQP